MIATNPTSTATPALRGRIAGAALLAVLALTGCGPLGSDTGSQTPAKGGTSPSAPPAAQPTPEPSQSSTAYEAPDDWTEPERWVALPRGSRRDKEDSEVGFPRTTEGGVAMLATANTTSIEGEQSTTDEQLRILFSYSGKDERTPANGKKVEKNATEVDEQLAREMGVAPGDPLPPGAYVRTHVVGYQVIHESGDEVGVWLLSRVVQKNGETAKESGSYTRTLMGTMWQDGDWKMTGRAILHAVKAVEGKPKPAMAAPGDAEFNKAGWTAIRQAS